jgi:membrane-associated protein
MRKIVLVVLAFLIFQYAKSQDSITVKFKNQYKTEAKDVIVSLSGFNYTVDEKGTITLPVNPKDSFSVSGKDYEISKFTLSSVSKENIITLKKKFTWKDLVTPMFYIIFGGIWFVIFVIFAETGLFAGFFLPGDSLLFVAGIYSFDLVTSGLGISGSVPIINLLILGVLISIAGILGNFVGYWFGRKSGPFLFERKDTFFFKKKYLFQAKELFDKHGGGAVVVARFAPILRTFAPIVAGIVEMDKKKYTYYNIVGSITWVFSMLFAGHYLQQLIFNAFNFDLKEHLEVIVIGIVAITTLPILYKLFISKTKTPSK